MKRIVILAVLVISAQLLVSCDPNNNYRMVVQNNTAYTLLIMPDSHVLPANGAAVLYQHDGLGGPGTNGTCVGSIMFDSITATVPADSSLRVTLNLNDENVWFYSKEGSTAKGFKTECRATISNEDIK